MNKIHSFFACHYQRGEPLHVREDKVTEEIRIEHKGKRERIKSRKVENKIRQNNRKKRR